MQCSRTFLFQMCSRTFLFQMCLSLLASMGSCTCKPTDNEVRRSEGSEEAARLQRESLQRLEQDLVGEEDASSRLENLQRLEQDLVGEEDASSRLENLLGTMKQDLVGEEDASSRLENLLGTMKEGFLRKLNLSDVPQESAKIQPPQFMMELYNKYASNSTAIPQSDVIRSFTVQDLGRSWRNGSRSSHRLLFNVSLPGHEKVTAAELRLFLACRRRPGPKATVKVYEVEDREGLDEPAVAHHLLEGKEVAGSSHGGGSSSWEMFDVTRAVLSWVRSGLVVNQFEVVVDGREDDDGGPPSCGVSTSIGDNSSAALIVFSDDLGSRRRETKKELKEMILHEEAAILFSGADATATEGAGQLPNELPEEAGQLPNELPEEAELPLHPRPRRRRRRKAEPREYCRRTSLKVNFKDIGWDSWIVAPPEYDAFECRGLCYHPLTDESTPSKHALIQTLVNILNPRRANMACCVPIKLDPITVMYQENGRLTIRYLYEEMKVAECGCR